MNRTGSGTSVRSPNKWLWEGRGGEERGGEGRGVREKGEDREEGEVEEGLNVRTYHMFTHTHTCKPHPSQTSQIPSPVQVGQRQPRVAPGT